MASGPNLVPSSVADRAAPLALWVVDLVAGADHLPDLARRHGLPLDASKGQLRLPIAGPREVARAALRIILAGYVGLEGARRPFIVATGGKPALDQCSNPPLDFSLAHCDTVAIVAISREGPVGVDIEAPRSVRIADHRRALLLEAATSLAPGNLLPDGPGEARFLQAWVRLEALAKLTGEGLGALLGRLDDNAPPIAGTIVNGSKSRIRDISVTDGPPLYSAVAGIGPAMSAEDAPVATWLPSERSWLESWVVRVADASPE